MKGRRKVALFKDPIHAEMYAAGLTAAGILVVEVVAYDSNPGYYYVEWKV